VVGVQEAAIEDVEEEDDQNVVTLLTDQLEFADTIILNKVDLVPRRKVKELIALVKALNPTAAVVPTTRCHIDLKEVLNTGVGSRASDTPCAGLHWHCKPPARISLYVPGITLVCFGIILVSP
jgi:G3E family GTPase